VKSVVKKIIMPPIQPNIFFIMTDQQRFDTIAALGNPHIYTPNLDRLVRRGISFTNAYSPCPVCVPARYVIRTGCEPHTTGCFTNAAPHPITGLPETVEGRCGPYLARTMAGLGYHTFGIGKFHTVPRWDEDLGYEFHSHSEELYGTPDQRSRDGFAGWIERQHPEFDYIEMLMGERTEMYYMPQASPLPAELTVERWAAERAVEQIQVKDGRPYFGFVSFIGPHPPFAPPLPYNRMYHPDRMPNPVRGELETDHMDEQIPWMNYLIWAEDINDSHARVLKARYYGEISYIDACLGRILDTVEASGQGENTLICFFSDHGDHLGDHHAWQKESFFEQSCHIPFLLSWPARLPADMRRDELVSLADLFGIAVTAGDPHPAPTSLTPVPQVGSEGCRQGFDLLGMLDGQVPPRQQLVGMYGDPGTPQFKIMIRQGEWKYIFMANGGREQLFNLKADPQEVVNLLSKDTDMVKELRKKAVEACRAPGAAAALGNDDLLTFPFQARPRERIYQFAPSRGVYGFPDRPQDALQ
jgi:arylsulfatase